MKANGKDLATSYDEADAGQRLHDAAPESFHAGQEAGHDAGFEEGWDEGWEAGYAAAMVRAFGAAFAAGYGRGFEEGRAGLADEPVEDF